MKRHALGIAAVLTAFLISSPILAQKGGVGRVTTQSNSGFGFGARALGMGGAFIAIADDASAASWNPAGIGQLIRPELTIVASTNSNETRVSGDQTTDSYTNAAGVPNGNKDFYTFSDQIVKQDPTGIDFLSFVQPFDTGKQILSFQLSYARRGRAATSTQSLNLQNSDNYYVVGNGTEALYSTTDYEITSSGSGGIDSFTFGVGTSFSEWLFVGASGELWRGTVGSTNEVAIRSFTFDRDLGVHVPSEDRRFSNSVERKIQAYSFNFGVLAKPYPWLSLGAVYRTKWSGTNDLNASYYEIGAVSGGYRRWQGTATTDSTIDWPDSWGVGMAIRPMPALTLSADYSVTNWSKGTTNPQGPFWFCDEAGHCTAQFNNVDVAFPSGGPVDQHGEKFQNDQDSLRFGAEYVFRPGRILVPVRAGYYRITSLAPLFDDRQFDSDPEADFRGYTAGLGIAFDMGNQKSLLLDFAATLEEADSSYNEQNYFRCYTNAQQQCSVYFLRTRTSKQEVRNTRLIGSLIYRF